MSALTVSSLRGGLGSTPTLPRKKDPVPVKPSSQEIVDDLIYYHGANVPNWSEWPALLAERGLVPGDVTREMIYRAAERAKTRKDPRRPLASPRTGDLAVAGPNGDLYPPSPVAGLAACQEWVSLVREMASRRNVSLSANAVLNLAHSRDRSLVGELLAEELKQEREQRVVQFNNRPAARNTAPKPNSPGHDRFGTKIGSCRADFNAAITTTPSTVEEILARSNVKEVYRHCRKWPHLQGLFDRGLLCRTADDRWYAPESSS